MRPKSVLETSSLSSHGRTVRRFAFKIAARLALKHALVGIAAWCFVWGMAVLILRAVIEPPRLILLWGAIGVPLIIGLAVMRARRQAPSLTTVRALLDEQSGCGGLLMAAETASLGDWQQRIPSLALPPVRWRGGRSWMLLLTALLFVATSFLIPVRFAAATSSRPLEVSEEVGQLEEQIETLKDEAIMDETKAESLQEKLDRLHQEAVGTDPVKTWEALDHVEANVSKVAQEASQDAVADTERLTDAQALAQGLSEDESAMDPKLMAEAMEQLTAMMKEASKEVDLLGKNLPAELQQALEAGSLTPEQLKALAEALRQSKGDIAKRLQKLRDAQLVDLKALSACEQAGQCDSAGLAAFLKQNAGNKTVAEMMDEWRQCEGGVSRGPGDAPMAWKTASSDEGAKFKEETLPPGALAALKESQLMGVSLGAPSVETTRSSRTGALSGAAAGGGSAHTQTVLPRHKGAVKRYFERP